MVNATHPGAVSGAVSTKAVTAATIIASLFIVSAGSYGPNFNLALLSAFVFVVGVACLWRPGEPPILLLVFLMQWLQGSTAIFQATMQGVAVDDFYQRSSAAGEATVLTLVALAALAIGMRLGVGPVLRASLQTARQLTQYYPLRSWFILYAAAWVVGAVASYCAYLIPALTHVLLGIESLHWAFFFMLAAAHFSRAKRGLWFYLAFGFELALGLGGYFSDFKTVFFVSFLALMTAGVRLTAQRIIMTGILAAAAFGFAVVWTAVKPEFRAFVSGGERSQIVTVDYPARIQKLGELASELNEEDLDVATNELFSRIAYVEHFGSALTHVPSSVPHEGGAIVADAIMRPFTPRFLFPDKTVIDDSERTRLYTGRFVSGAERGTSISLGWPAEVYVDFGRWGMMVAALGVGLFYGLIQRVLTRWPWSRGIIGYGVSAATLLSVAMLETSLTKALGGILATLLAAFFLLRFVVPLWCPWVLGLRR